MVSTDKISTKLSATIIATAGLLALAAPAYADSCETGTSVSTDLISCDAQAGVSSDGQGTVTVTASAEIGANARPVPGVYVGTGVAQDVEQDVDTPTVTTPGVSTPGVDTATLDVSVGPAHVSVDVDVVPIHVGSLTIGIPAAEFSVHPLWGTTSPSGQTRAPAPARAGRTDDTVGAATAPSGMPSVTAPSWAPGLHHEVTAARSRARSSSAGVSASASQGLHRGLTATAPRTSLFGAPLGDTGSPGSVWTWLALVATLTAAGAVSYRMGVRPGRFGPRAAF